MLTDYHIVAAREQGDLAVEPWDLELLGPASYDLTLSNVYRRPQPGIGHLDMGELEGNHTVLCESDGPITINPRSVLLCSSMERIKLGRTIGARVEGKSSIGRIWLLVHATAGFIDPGFEGNVTLEVVNLSPWPIDMHPGQRIAQLAFFHMSGPARRLYGERGSYQGQAGPTESRFQLDRWRMVGP